MEEHPRTIVGFVLSLVGLVTFWPLGIVGLVLSNQARRDMRAAPGRYANEGLATAGVVLGWICVALLAMALLALVALLLFLVPVRLAI